VGEKFDICAAIAPGGVEARAAFLAAMTPHAEQVIGAVCWMLRLRADDIVDEGSWTGEPLELAPAEIVCLYPLSRSTRHGAWLVESVSGADVWTLAVPVEVLDARGDAVLEAMWAMSEWGVPCVAGNEYSMNAVLHAGLDPLQEIAAASSLATSAVTRSRVPGWSRVETRGDRVRIVRKA
jgi:hypothetical protein